MVDHKWFRNRRTRKSTYLRVEADVNGWRIPVACGVDEHLFRRYDQVVENGFSWTELVELAGLAEVEESEKLSLLLKRRLERERWDTVKAWDNQSCLERDPWQIGRARPICRREGRR